MCSSDLAAGIQVVYLGIWPLPTLIDPDTALKGTLRLVHVSLNYTLLAVVALHVLAVVKHQLLDRQNILARMLPFGTPRAVAGKLQGEGWKVVQGLEPVADATAEARRLGASHLLRDGAAHAVS